jgi:protein-disulfide isomerase
MTSEKVVSKRQARREQMQKRSQRQRLITIGIIILGAVLIVLPIAYQMLKPAAAVQVIDPGDHPNPNGSSMGDANAPIKIEEFSDFQCPYCERFHKETEPLLRKYYIDTGKVLFTYRSMGNWVSGNIGGANTESQDAALAAYCAGDQNKFWEMHAMLFGNVIGENVGSFTDKRLLLIAQKVQGLDVNQFQSCYNSGKYTSRVTQDFNDGQAAGITGTPGFVMTYVVNGQTKTERIDGAESITTFQQKIEAALNEMGVQ